MRVSQMLLALAIVSGCDLSVDTCGPVHVEDARGYCVCPPNTVPNPTGGSSCIACKANEMIENGRCACKAGWARPTPTAECVEAPAAVGAPCDIGTRPCVDPQFNHCHADMGTAGYCTRMGCAASSECPATYACMRDASPPYCKRPPTGQGKTCASTADCVGGEATFCDNMFLKQCLVEGCRPGAMSGCHEGWTCCDLARFGLAKTLCVPQAELDRAYNGKCPGT